MTTKGFSVSFYVATVRHNGNRLGLETVLGELLDQNAPPVLEREDDFLVVKDLESWNNGRNFKGVFGKIRMRDLPHKADRRGHEEDIRLGRDEGLIEKNHFIFTARRQLLIYQENFHGSFASSMANYLTRFSRRTVSFGPVLNPGAMARLMRAGTEVRKLDLSVARPRNPEMFPRDNFSREVLQLMASGDAATISIHMSANGPGQRGNRLSNRVRRAMKDLVEGDHARKAYVEVESDEGRTFPIDLLVDRIRVRKEVEMDGRGRYPVTDRMYEALEGARRDSQGLLDAYFEQDDDAAVD